MSSLLQRTGFKARSSPHGHSRSSATFRDADLVPDSDLKYVGEQGGNTSDVGYQEASGAPVEVISPLGYAVGPVTIVFLNFSKMVGTGIFSTPSSILSGTGSIGLSLIFWTVGLFISMASLSVYLEYAACFPSRSGSEVAYLEQAYPRPRWFFPTTFAIQTVIFSFSSANAVVMAQYLFATGDYQATGWELKGLAIGCYTVAVLSVIFHTRFSYLASNVIGMVKLVTLVFIGIVGLVVLGGHTSVKDPKLNFRDAFEGEASPYGVTNALYKIIFAYAGYENAFNVVNEVKNPVKHIRNNGFAAVIGVAILYILANVAYFAAIPKAEIIEGREIAAGLLFTYVFGDHSAVRGLNFLIALSSFGNLIAVLLGQSRMMREAGRQGVLPYPGFWASTWPFGTPSSSYLVKWLITVIMILAPPAGDAFSFVTDLGIYPASVFNLAMSIGLYLLRRQRSRSGLPRPSFRVWDPILLFNTLVQLYLVVMPWYPPANGANGGDVSFWYATYVVVGIGLLAICAAYYFVWIIILPKLKGYEIRQEVMKFGNGVQAHILRKVPLAQLEEWDRTHDASGHGTSQQWDDNESDGSTQVTAEVKQG